MRVAVGCLISLFLGCGSEPVKALESLCPDIKVVERDYPHKRKGSKVEDVFLPHVRTFERITGIKVIDIPITFEKQEGDTIGICWSYVYIFGSIKEILIDPDYWKTASDNAKETLILHELGHCAKGREHIEEKSDREGYSKIPTSIMFPYNIGGYGYYQKFKDYYHKELGEVK